MTLTAPSIDITRKEPSDARLIKSERYTAGNIAPTTVTPTGYLDVDKYLSVNLVVSADATTGSGDSLTFSVWRYRRKTDDDPLGGGASFYWTKGETITIDDLDYDASAKEFSILTNGCDRIYFELSSFPTIAWVRFNSYVGITRNGAIPALTVQDSSTSTTSVSSNVNVTNSSITVDNDVLTDVHDDVGNALNVAEIDPIYTNWSNYTLVDGSGTDDTYYYIIDMATYKKIGLHLVLYGGTAGAGPTGVTATVEATLEPGVAAGSVSYWEDVTSGVFGVASLVAAPTVTSTDIWSDSAEKLSVTRLVRVKIVADTNSDSGTWKIFVKKL